MAKRSSKIYTEMLDYLEAMIVRGSFPPGTKLPSQRRLASQFLIPQSTVGRKLKELEDRGLIELRRGSGAYVRDRRQRRSRKGKKIGVIIEAINIQTSYCGHVLIGLQERAEELGCHLKLHFTEYRSSSSETFRKLAADADGVILLGCYDTVLESLPHIRPCVGVNMHRTYDFASTIDLDPVRAAELATEYFQKLQCRQVHLIGYDIYGAEPKSAFDFRGRLFAEYWRGHGELISHQTPMPRDLDLDGLDDFDLFTDPAAGYLFVGGTRAQGAAQIYLERTGKSLYEDFNVLSIDGKSLLRPDYFPVDTIAANYPSMGRMALDECLRRIAVPGEGPQRIYQNVFLSYRKSRLAKN